MAVLSVGHLVAYICDLFSIAGAQKSRLCDLGTLPQGSRGSLGCLPDDLVAERQAADVILQSSSWWTCTG